MMNAILWFVGNLLIVLGLLNELGLTNGVGEDAIQLGLLVLVTANLGRLMLLVETLLHFTAVLNEEELKEKGLVDRRKDT